MAPQNPIYERWQRLNGTGLGRWLFSRAVGLMAPYSGTIRALVEQLEPGRAVITIRDRRRVRNHLRSIHAAALLNLCELTGGLLASVSMPADARMIITRVTVDFVKKARGRLKAEGRCTIPTSNQPADLPVTVVVRDQSGDEVASGTVTTLLGPVPR